MNGDTEIARLAALLGDSSRCRVLLALDDGRALPASVLAAEAGVSPSTASEHLGKLVGAGLLTVEVRGRHRYYRLAGEPVGRLLETLAEYAPQASVRSLREDTRAHALRQARCCYDHLAGRLAVALLDALLDRGVLIAAHGQPDPNQGPTDRLSGPDRDVEYRLTSRGSEWLRDFGIDLDAIEAGRRPLIRCCLDWSEQRHHLGGALGHALAERMFELNWLIRSRHGRVVSITSNGAHALAAQFEINLETPAPYRGGRMPFQPRQSARTARRGVPVDS